MKGRKEKHVSRTEVRKYNWEYSLELSKTGQAFRQWKQEDQFMLILGYIASSRLDLTQKKKKITRLKTAGFIL